MAFPVVAARITGRTTNTNTTTHAITLPTGVVAGNLLVVVFSTDGNPTVTAQQAGWTKLNQASSTTVVTGAIFWKIATGSDALTLVTSVVEASSHASFRITGGGTPTATSANGTTANSDPPPHTPPAGSRDYLWIATRSADSTNVATVAPASYANLQTQAATGTGGASTNTAERSLTTATENPGTFTSTAIGWVAWTISVPPADQSAAMDPVASSASVALPTVVVPQVRSMAVVAAGSVVATPTVPTHYPVLVASTASVATPAGAKQTSTPALVTSTAAVPTVTTKLTVTALLVASTASVATPTVIGTQVIFLAPVVSTATVAAPTVATRYPTVIASTATVATPVLATHYPVTIGSTAAVPAPTVVVWLRPTTVVNRPSLLTTSTSRSPSTSLLPSAGGDRFYPPANITVNLASTHLPELVVNVSTVATPAVTPGVAVAHPVRVTAAPTIGEIAGIDLVSQLRYPRPVTSTAIPSTILVPTRDLAPSTGPTTVFPPTVWQGSPQTHNAETVASTAAVPTPAVSLTVHPRFLSRTPTPSTVLAPSTSLILATGLSTVHLLTADVVAAPAFLERYPSENLHPGENLYPSGSSVLAPTVELGVVTLTPASIPSGSTVGIPTPSGSGVNFVPLFYPVRVENPAAVAEPTVFAESTTVEPEFLDTEESVEGPNIVLQGETLLHLAYLDSAATIGPPALSTGTARVHPAVISSTESVALPRIVILQIRVMHAVVSSAAVGLPRIKGKPPRRDPYTNDFSAGSPVARSAIGAGPSVVGGIHTGTPIPV